MATAMAEFGTMLRTIRQSAGTVAVEVIINFAAPYLIYRLADPRYGDIHALMASSAPPLAWSLIEFIRKRRIDAVSLLVLAGIILSLLAFLGGGSVRFLQLRENLVTGLIALIFLGSAAIKKPVIYHLARAGQLRKSAAHAEQFATLRGRPRFERIMMQMTLVWGFGLLAQTILACILVFAMPIADYLIVSPILGYGTMGGLALWTWWYAKRSRARAEAAARNEQP